MLFCEDVEAMLQDYQDGYLLPSQREILESHVRACPKCRELVSELSRLDSRMGSLCVVDVPHDLTRTILAALPAQPYGPSPLRRALSWGAAPALAILLVLAGLLVKGRIQLRDQYAAHEVNVMLQAPQATSVAIVGDFNGWNPEHTRLIRSSREGLWRAQLKLPPGIYQYSFVLDGTTWITDPLAKSMVADGFGGRNSVMVVDG